MCVLCRTFALCETNHFKCYSLCVLADSLGTFASLMAVAAFFLPFMAILDVITAEKESKMKAS